MGQDRLDRCGALPITPIAGYDLQALVQGLCRNPAQVIGDHGMRGGNHTQSAVPIEPGQAPGEPTADPALPVIHDDHRAEPGSQGRATRQHPPVGCTPVGRREHSGTRPAGPAACWVHQTVGLTRCRDHAAA